MQEDFCFFVLVFVSVFCFCLPQAEICNFLYKELTTVLCKSTKNETYSLTINH